MLQRPGPLVMKRMSKRVAVVTGVVILGTLIVLRAVVWSGTLDPSFLVPGLSGQTFLTLVVPQIAVGTFDGGRTKYVTRMTRDRTLGSVFAEVFDSNGDVSLLTCLTNDPLRPFFRGTALVGFTLPILVVTADETGLPRPKGPFGPPIPNMTDWARFQFSGSYYQRPGGTITTTFEIRDGTTGALYSSVAVPYSLPNMSRFRFLRDSDADAGIDVGFAIVNTGATAAAITGSLVDAEGQTIASRSVTLAARRQIAQFAGEFFELKNESPGPRQLMIYFDSPSAQFAAIALSFRGGVPANVAIEQLR